MKTIEETIKEFSDQFNKICDKTPGFREKAAQEWHDSMNSDSGMFNDTSDMFEIEYVVAVETQ